MKSDRNSQEIKMTKIMHYTIFVKRKNATTRFLLTKIVSFKKANKNGRSGYDKKRV